MSRSGAPQRKPRGQRKPPDGWERPADFSKRNRMGINQVYAAVRSGELPHVRIGATILIPVDALERRLVKS